MIGLGTALKSTEPPFHRCLVISDPNACDGVVVLVRITTDDGTWPERDAAGARKPQRRIRNCTGIATSRRGA